MKRKVFFLFTTIVISCLLLWYDYHNYYRGGSFIDYKRLPMNLSPFYFKSYDNVNGETNSIRFFCFTFNEYGEFIGHGYRIASNSNKSWFVVQNIVSYYYNSNDILIQCIDTNGDMHWVRPFRTNKQLFFKEVAGIENFDIDNYKYIRLYTP
ncbi:MAG: hypothetical protein VZR53_15835 [Prevotella sp.]|nr:hypothetical protein [Prevotella sp.]